MNLKPLSNRVLIEPLEEKETTKSGIILPETAEKKKQKKGIVISVGDGKLNEKSERVPISVKTGDKVIFKEPWSEENKIEDGDKSYFIVEEDDILAIIN